MITLPVTAQMYHQLVQQQMPNNDNTVCVTPMQVQNFISNNSLCGSIANSNSMNASTTYIMTANNRNVINLPLQTAAASNSIKSAVASTATSQNVCSPNTRTILKKTFMKKRVLNLAMSKTKLNANLSQSDVKKSANNNNSSNVKNKNQKLEKLQASQNKTEVIEEKNDSLIDDPGETKVKNEEEESKVEIE